MGHQGTAHTHIFLGLIPLFVTYCSVQARGMTFWSNVIAQTAAGDGVADEYQFSTKLGVPVTKQQGVWISACFLFQV